MIDITTYITIAVTSIPAWFGIKTWLTKKQNVANKTKLDANVNNAVKHVAVQQVHIDKAEEQKIEVEKGNYIILGFTAQNIIQQVVLIWKQDDTYADEIIDRILNSIELIKIEEE